MDNQLTHFLARVLMKTNALYSDRVYLRMLYYLTMGKKLHLDAPKTMNEKLQWLKLYNHKPEYTTYADKFAVRAFIKERIGEDHLIPLLGVYDSWDQIDFERV